MNLKREKKQQNMMMVWFGWCGSGNWIGLLEVEMSSKTLGWENEDWELYMGVLGGIFAFKS